MSVNTAVTTNGAKYNKLKRPDDFLEVTASANEGAKPDIAHTIAPKRSLDDADLSDDDDFDEVEEQNKRPRLQNVREGRKKGFRPPVGENGMQSMFPGMIDDGNISDDSTNEALAYLRSVR